MSYFNLRSFIRSSLMEMSTRYKRETGQNLPRWREKLMQYADSGENFVHFSHFPKLGLNPINNYDTPTGFYIYPLKRGRISSFATDRPYAIVVSPNDTGNILYLKDYTEDDLASDVVKLQDQFGLTKSMELSAQALARVKTPGGILWNITRMMINSYVDDKRKKPNPAWTSERSNHYDDLLGVAEKLSSVPAKDRKRKKQDLTQEFMGYANNPQSSKEDRDFWREMSHIIRGMSPDMTPAEIRRQINAQKEFVVNPRASSWTQVMRALGYDGVVDEGQSIIHPSEPHQAVFFTTGALQLLDVINKGKGGDLSDLKSAGEKEVNITFDQEYTGETFTGGFIKDSIGEEVLDATFTNCTFKDTSGGYMSLGDSKFQDCTFENVNLIGAGLTGVACANTDFKGVNFTNVHAVGATFKSVRFMVCTFDETALGDATFSSCIFTNCEFKGVSLDDATFYNSQIVSPKSGLERVSLAGTDITGLLVSPITTPVPHGFRINRSTKKLEHI